MKRILNCSQYLLKVANNLVIIIIDVILLLTSNTNRERWTIERASQFEFVLKITGC